MLPRTLHPADHVQGLARHFRKIVKGDLNIYLDPVCYLAARLVAQPQDRIGDPLSGLLRRGRTYRSTAVSAARPCTWRLCNVCAPCMLTSAGFCVACQVPATHGLTRQRVSAIQDKSPPEPMQGYEDDQIQTVDRAQAAARRRAKSSA
jgi:hypothetical protein